MCWNHLPVKCHQTKAMLIVDWVRSSFSGQLTYFFDSIAIIIAKEIEEIDTNSSEVMSELLRLRFSCSNWQLLTSSELFIRPMAVDSSLCSSIWNLDWNRQIPDLGSDPKSDVWTQTRNRADYVDVLYFLENNLMRQMNAMKINLTSSVSYAATFFRFILR